MAIMKKIAVLLTIAMTAIMSTTAMAAASLTDTIVAGVTANKTTIDVTACDATVAQVMKEFATLFNTNPVMNKLDGTIKCDYKGTKATAIKIGYLNTNTGDSDAVLASIVATAKTKATTAEKVKSVHDDLIAKADYDYTYKATTIYDLLVNGKGTCIAYSMTFQSAMQQLGIPCVTVVEKDNSHAWNQVNVDGTWYNIDVTYDENYSKSATASPYTFFLKSDATFKLSQHHDWKGGNPCGVDYK